MVEFDRGHQEFMMHVSTFFFPLVSRIINISFIPWMQVAPCGMILLCIRGGDPRTPLTANSLACFRSGSPGHAAVQPFFIMRAGTQEPYSSVAGASLLFRR